ncbi:MAG: ion channel [Colwellia sp.]|nr:ion channel [Colwellia sp.]
MKIKSHSVDSYGIKNYNTGFLLIIALLVLYITIAILSFGLVHYEAGALNSNITTYKDAFWTLQMSASTIGFGDFYPITLEGRLIVAAMFYLGVGLVGFIGAQFIDRFVGFSDTNVKNRELRQQNKEIIAQNELLDQKLENLLEKVELLSKR